MRKKYTFFPLVLQHMWDMDHGNGIPALGDLAIIAKRADLDEGIIS